jgi:hypothetical protein
MDFMPSRSRAKNIFGNMFSTAEEDTPNKGMFRHLFDPAQIDNVADKPVGRSLDERTGRISAASSKLMDLYNEDSPATKRYDDYLAAQPTEEQYKPSGKRRLGAALAGFAVGLSDPNAGGKLASDIVESPFRSAIKNWERQRLPLQNAAVSEGRDRTNKISALKDYIQSEHQAAMDESTLADRKHDNNIADNTLLETIADRQARAKALEEERKRQEANRTEDNKRADAAAIEAKRHNQKSESIAERGMTDREARTQAYTNNLKNLTAYRDHLKEKVTTQGNTPGGQKTAEELATHEVLLKPGNSQRYSDFFEQNSSTGKMYIVAPKKGAFQSDEDFNAALAEYTILQSEIKKEKEAILAPLRKPSTSNESTKPKRQIQIVGKERG